MMINSKIHEVELLFCKAIAIKLGFKQSIVDQMVVDIIKLINEGVDANVSLDILSHIE